MNSETLRHIFKVPFDYKTYCNEIVHRLFGCNDVASRPELLDTNAEGDQSYFIGQMDDTDGRLLGFFYTRVAEGSDVRRKRVGLRKLISPYLKYDVDGAIAVFDDGRHWRLSYICDLKEGSTSAKRFSYIMGDEQGQYKTPLERLDKIARLNGRIKLSDLKESFSVDALSDEFFNEYHIHYDRIVAELTRQGKSGAVYHDYVKKLMGRIVFLYFLQKKGWLCKDTNFMYNTFLGSNRQNDYLESVLEPLFFGILNTQPAKREQVFVKNGWQQSLVGKWASIPYLNGGLFERDEIDKMNIKLPASLFDNIFNFLASYNFTVDENDPDDAEIGVDPEMLGKIFESLLEDNKAKGAFYTPKEIVRYMCKESLIAHLASKLPEVSDAVIRTFVETHEMQPELEPYRKILSKTLREVKICDPAIGSGAFPMGLLNELWRCREALSTSLAVETQNFASLQPSHRAALKREIIENNIYGVDIERGAIDIARLRFWLSIVVDSEEPQPLPNFDYKFMQGNSLIESYGGYDLSRISARQRGGQSKSTQLLLGLDSDLNRKNLQRLMRDYFSVTDHKQKAVMRQAINDAVRSLIREYIGATDAKLSALNPSANQEFFLWHTWFKDVFDGGGFDIVIGNPPYVVVPVGLYPNYEWNTDLYKMFFELSLKKLCCSNGIVTLITPKFYMLNKDDSKMRLYFMNHTELLFLTTCNPFEAVTENVITVIRATSPQSNTVPYFDYNSQSQTFVRLEDLDKNYCKTNKYNEMIFGISNEIISILQKMYKKGKALGDLTESKRGAEVSKNYLRENNSGIETLIGQDMKKYSISWNATYLPKSHKEYGRLHLFFDSEVIYLRRVDSMLEATISPGIHFGYNKNVYGIRKRSNCAYEIRYLLACINSKAVDFYYKKKFSTKKTDVFPEIQTYLYEQLPIPPASKEQQRDIIDLVDKILIAKKANPQADTSALEREIDKKVYELYGLGPEEIAVIEGA